MVTAAESEFSLFRHTNWRERSRLLLYALSNKKPLKLYGIFKEVKTL